MNNAFAAQHMKILTRVKDARKEAGLSQEDVAKRLGKVRSAYSHYESGRLAFSLDMIFQLSQILGRSPEWLLALDTTLSDDESTALMLYREAAARGAAALAIKVLQAVAVE